MDGVEAEGRTVNEAIESALEELGLTRDQVDIEILTEGRPRLLGFRGEPARVRATPKPEPVAPPASTRRTTVVDEEPEDEDDYDGEVVPSHNYWTEGVRGGDASRTPAPGRASS